MCQGRPDEAARRLMTPPARCIDYNLLLRDLAFRRRRRRRRRRRGGHRRDGRRRARETRTRFHKVLGSNDTDFFLLQKIWKHTEFQYEKGSLTTRESDG